MIIIVSILVFLLMRLLPGDPLFLYISENQIMDLTQADIQALRIQFGLDKPLLTQYVCWITDLFHGDFGTSIFYRDSVGTLIAERLPVTFHLGILALTLSSILGILAGVISALRRGRRLDLSVTSIANIGISVPVFWLGILMIYLFGLRLGWLPLFGYTSPFKDFWLSTRQLIMPVLCLAVIAMAANTRQTRSSMLEVVRQDYVRTAWSKGLTERTIVMRHCLRNSLIPVISLIGIHASHILGGSVLIEKVFNIPGMGRLLVDAVFSHDYPIVQAVSLLMAVTVVLVNLAVDISYTWLDPRVRYDKAL